MTPEQKDLVQESFALVAPIGDQAGELFYARLFQLDPSLRALFRGDIREQSRKLMHMLAVAVRGLDDLDSIVPAVQALGRRHVGYGVTQSHFDTVAAALLSTLEIGLGPHFTSEVRQAWVAVYALLSGTMVAAMQPATAEAASTR
ncbi:MAG TPA: globin family protein [Chloroflexota bacterium]|jgi:hemoglobin-like flavoprotein